MITRLSSCLALSILVFLFGESPVAFAQLMQARFNVLAIAETGDMHAPFVVEAKKWLAQQAVESGFTVDYVENTDSINDTFLAKYQLFIQLNYPPYRWTDTAKKAFKKYIAGKGGWVGFHHAALLGEFDGYEMWPWFSEFMGGIRYKNYIATFAEATVQVEASSHPVMRGLPKTFTIEKEEWYTFNKSPRSNVKVLATVDESTYVPDSKIKMGGDHPVIWSNERVQARNVYIFMGHHPNLFKNKAFTQLFRNAIFWGAAYPKQ